MFCDTECDRSNSAFPLLCAACHGIEGARFIALRPSLQRELLLCSSICILLGPRNLTIMDQFDISPSEGSKVGKVLMGSISECGL
jgi:hypothetical protein